MNNKFDTKYFITNVDNFGTIGMLIDYFIILKRSILYCTREICY